MQLTSLEIHLEDYGVNKGRYTGSAHFKGEYGGVDIVLHPDVSDAVLKLCADALVKNSRDLAEQLTAETLTQAAGSLPPPLDE